MNAPSSSLDDIGQRRHLFVTCRTSPTRKPLLVAVAVLLAACSASEPGQAGAADPGIAAPNAVSADSGDAVARPMAPAAPSQPPVPVEVKLALDGEGLRSFAVSNGYSRLIGFGTRQDEAIRLLEAVMGMPASERGENIDCAARYATWPNGLTAWFARSEFAGWSVDSVASTVTTAGSLKVGSTREQLESAYDARIAPSTLGTQFSAGGISGLLDSPDAGARITDLWAGTTCIAR